MSEENKSTSSHKSVSERKSSISVRNTLMREGIMPTTANPFGLATYRPRTNSAYKLTDQEKLNNTIFERRISSILTRRSSTTVIDNSSWQNMFLDKSEWISLGEGWYQITLIGSGSTDKYGLHSMVESFAGKIFIAIFEPRTIECLYSCTSDSPSYNLENINDYCLVTCDYISKRWIISRFLEGEETIISEATDLNIKVNLFYEMLIQIRDNALSIDVNGGPLFTAVRLVDGSTFSGLVGVQAKGSKFAIKGWKLKAIDTPNKVDVSSMSASFTNQASFPSSSSMNSSYPRPLSEIVKEKYVSSKVSSVTTISSEPPLPWGSSGGPGKPQVDSRPVSLSRTQLAPPRSRKGRANSLSIDTNSFKKSSERSDNDSTATTSSQLSQSFTSVQTQNELNLSDIANQLHSRHEKGTVDTVFRDVVQKDLGVTFDDIAALETAKRLLNEAVILPLIMPELFTGIREPWKGVLLFGPPGTGKTLLAKAVCSFSGSTFFNCSAATLISKYRGESEKIVRCLFEAARLCAPSIVFLDEVDALVSSRGSDNEHEASRRMKTEIFSQMDGIASHGRYVHQGTLPGSELSSDSQVSGQGVMVLATTNCPWDLDDALRRRLEKRIYIELPDSTARYDIFKICLKDIAVHDDVDCFNLATLTEGYSGADIHIICREASMMPIRRLMNVMSPQEIQQKRFLGILEIPKVLYEDFIEAIRNTRPSVSSSSIAKFIAWEREYGSK